MLLIEYDDIVQTLSPDTSDDPLAVWILPRRSGCNLHFFKAQVANSVLERGAVDGIPVPQQVTRRGVPRKSLDDLLRGPLGGWVFGNVKMEYPRKAGHFIASMTYRHGQLPLARQGQLIDLG